MYSLLKTNYTEGIFVLEILTIQSESGEEIDPRKMDWFEDNKNNEQI